MNTPQAIAKHCEELFFSNNWTGSAFPAALDGITWKDAVLQIKQLNTIAVLVYHTGFYFKIQIRVLEGGPIQGTDKESFLVPNITNEEKWSRLKTDLFETVKKFISLLKEFPEDELHKDFSDGRFGSNFRNFIGVIEHSHYHLGQIVLLKKLL